jgi:chromosome segregation ATPase
MRDALSASRTQLERQRLRDVSALPAGARRGTGFPIRTQEELDLANAECAALRDEAVELENEAHELRAALEEHESSRHAQSVVHQKLTNSLSEAQAAIKKLVSENSTISAESQRLRALMAEFEASRSQVLAQLTALEHDRGEFVSLAQNANVGFFFTGAAFLHA